MKDYSNIITSISKSVELDVNPVEVPKAPLEKQTDSLCEVPLEAENISSEATSENSDMPKIEDIVNDKVKFMASWTKVNTSSNGCGCNNACFNSCFNVG